MERTRNNSTENQEMTDDLHQSVTSSPSKTLISSTHHQSQDHIDVWTNRLDQVLDAHQRGSWNPDRIQTPRVSTPVQTPPKFDPTVTVRYHLDLSKEFWCSPSHKLVDEDE